MRPLLLLLLLLLILQLYAARPNIDLLKVSCAAPTCSSFALASASAPCCCAAAFVAATAAEASSACTVAVQQYGITRTGSHRLILHQLHILLSHHVPTQASDV